MFGQWAMGRQSRPKQSKQARTHARTDLCLAGFLWLCSGTHTPAQVPGAGLTSWFSATNCVRTGEFTSVLALDGHFLLFFHDN